MFCLHADNVNTLTNKLLDRVFDLVLFTDKKPEKCNCPRHELTHSSPSEFHSREKLGSYLSFRFLCMCCHTNNKTMCNIKLHYTDQAFHCKRNRILQHMFNEYSWIFDNFGKQFMFCCQNTWICNQKCLKSLLHIKMKLRCYHTVQVERFKIFNA